jgi:hypothetical protein
LALREGHADDNAIKLAAMINQGLSKLPVDSGTIYRGTRIPSRDIERFYKALESGRPVTLPEFLSFSADREVALDFMDLAAEHVGDRAIFAVRDNHRAPSIRELAMSWAEDERLHPSLSWFRVVKIDKHPHNYVQIELEQIDARR